MNAPVRPPTADCRLPSLDDLAAALGRARAAHERRPDDHRLYAAMLEAEVAYLNAELARRDRAFQRERMRAAEIGRRLQEASSAGRRDRDKQDAARGAATGTRDLARQSAVGGRQSALQPRRRRRAAIPAGVPLLDFAGVGA